ncbi:MAG: glycerol-3-phosphate 1-O-acyltransferase PlsY [Gemmatimonadetes bacterium]|nr:glycerol-3-phosphate 1-O-acyltransferase PlsY [Gemmatimonadota bacterium]
MTAAVVVGLAVAYVCGSLPSAYLAGRWTKGVDLRTVGSGNLGATNVYRELGTGPAIAVLVVDMIKGAVPALFIPRFIVDGVSAESLNWWALAFGGAAIAGHAKPVFLLWKGGGKGVATAAGVFFALTPMPMAICLLVFVAVAATTRFISLASIVAAAALPFLQWGMAGDVAAITASGVVAVFVIWAHRGNIKRLLAGIEPRFSRRPKEAA